jgi:hypothetical protein
VCRVCGVQLVCAGCGDHTSLTSSTAAAVIKNSSVPFQPARASSSHVCPVVEALLVEVCSGGAPADDVILKLGGQLLSTTRAAANMHSVGSRGFRTWAQPAWLAASAVPAGQPPASKSAQQAVSATKRTAAIHVCGQLALASPLVGPCLPECSGCAQDPALDRFIAVTAVVCGGRPLVSQASAGDIKRVLVVPVQQALARLPRTHSLGRPRHNRVSRRDSDDMCRQASPPCFLPNASTLTL